MEANMTSALIELYTKVNSSGGRTDPVEVMTRKCWRSILSSNLPGFRSPSLCLKKSFKACKYFGLIPKCVTLLVISVRRLQQVKKVPKIGDFGP